MTHHLPAPISTSLAQVGQVANTYASQNVFTDYQGRISANTLRRQADDLALFSYYLAATGVVIEANDLLHDPTSWHGITYGLVDSFVRWMLAEGYAIGSVNVRLSTIKVYCKLVAKSGVLPPAEYALIRLVTGYRHAEGRNIDQRRGTVRKGDKKAVAVSITSAQSTRLKSQPDTPQGYRDALLMCLLLDLGFRCGEVAALTPDVLNLDEGTLVLYREKVDKTQTHKLTADALEAAKRYLLACQPSGRLLMGSRKGGKLQGVMSTRAITDRVKVLGEQIGIEGLSAHDSRHYSPPPALHRGTTTLSFQ